jgi:hypothetical protein
MTATQLTQRHLILSLAVLFLCNAASMMAADAKHQGMTGGEAELRSVLMAFLKPGADYESLTQKLRPTAADYTSLFREPFATKIREALEAASKGDEGVLKPKDGQTEVLLRSVATDEIRLWTTNAKEILPGGYESVRSEFKPGNRIYVARFVSAGESTGLVFRMVFVNGNWRIVPKVSALGPIKESP